jgi:hypothetical protein
MKVVMVVVMPVVEMMPSWGGCPTGWRPPLCGCCISSAALTAVAVIEIITKKKYHQNS